MNSLMSCEISTLGGGRGHQGEIGNQACDENDEFLGEASSV